MSNKSEDSSYNYRKCILRHGDGRFPPSLLQFHYKEFTFYTVYILIENIYFLADWVVRKAK